MTRKVIFATGNEGKLREVRAILSDLDVRVLSLREAGITLEVEENGATFAENALIKARACAGRTDGGAVVLADDSGLEIDALNREPGVYSSRYLGENTSYHVKNKTLIERLAGVPPEKRTARFVCAIAAVLPDGSGQLTEGVMEGRIGYEEAGTNGFGYDPIFYLPEYGCTSAELSPEQKNVSSHRGRALERMKERLLAMGVFQRAQESRADGL